MENSLKPDAIFVIFFSVPGLRIFFMEIPGYWTGLYTAKIASVA